MTTVHPTAMASAPQRNLNNAQRAQRSMIWFGLFFVLGVITLILGLVLMAINDILSTFVFGIGGLATLIIPGMISRCLYIVSEYEHVIVLKLGKFVGVRGVLERIGREEGSQIVIYGMGG